MPKNITREELRARGFVWGGTVSPDPTPLQCVNPGAQRERWEGIFRVDTTWTGQGLAVYLMVVDGEVKKAGQTGNGGASFSGRMKQSFSCIRPAISEIKAGRLVRVNEGLCYASRGVPKQPLVPFDEDFPWKHRVPQAMLDRQSVELWVKELAPMPGESDLALRRRIEDEEHNLNEEFRGEWAKEGWTRDRERREAE